VTGHRSARVVGVAVLGLLLAAACAKKSDVVVESSAGKALGSAEIDRDPLALLPAGAIGVVSLDATVLFASPFGQKLLALAEARLPLPAAAGFEPKRDLEHLYAGSYSMDGVDVAGVAIGHFDQAKIEAAADGTQTTPLGVPVTKSSYAGRKLYSAGNVGFTLLSARTALFGNETGIRRALDRIQDGHAKRELPAWMLALLAEQKAPLVGGADLRTHPVSDAARSQLPFLNGLETAAVVGNFQDPGLNFAGTLTYPDEAGASAGAGQLLETRQTLDAYAPFLAMLGIPQPVKQLEARAEGKKVECVIGVDGQAIGVVLDKAQDFLGVPAGGGTVPATSSPSVAE
jgi:hypothetical protein